MERSAQEEDRATAITYLNNPSQRNPPPPHLKNPPLVPEVCLPLPADTQKQQKAGSEKRKAAWSGRAVAGRSDSCPR